MAWPGALRIGTPEAFEVGEEYRYEHMYISDENLYVCTRGSEWAREDEKLVLRHEILEDGSWAWIAYDASMIDEALYCRQAVFRCVDENITEAGFYTWQTNYNADQVKPGVSINWQGNLVAETRV